MKINKIMRIDKILLTICLLLPIGLSGCQAKPETPAKTEEPTNVTRTTPEPATKNTPQTPATPANVIQTQTGPDGLPVNLAKAQVNGDILTVEVHYSGLPPNQNGGNKFETRRVPISGVSYVDDATSKKYSVLKDSSGVWQAAPIDREDIHFVSKTGSPQVVWFKFPAPPAESQTVSITIPNVGPFNGVRVQR